MEQWPVALYKRRPYRGVYKYQHIEGNIYEDTSCRHGGEHCRITVKPEGDHYIFDGCVNDSAREYKDFHTCEYIASEFYTDPETPMILSYRHRVSQHEQYLEEYKKELADAQAALAGSEEVYTRPQILKGLKIGDTIVTGGKEVALEYKVMGRKGLAYFIDELDRKVYETEDKKWLKVTESYYDEDYESCDDRELCGFLTQDDLARFEHNKRHHELEKNVDRAHHAIKMTESSLEELKAELEKYEQIKNGGKND